MEDFFELIVEELLLLFRLMLTEINKVNLNKMKINQLNINNCSSYFSIRFHKFFIYSNLFKLKQPMNVQY